MRGPITAVGWLLLALGAVAAAPVFAVEPDATGVLRALPSDPGAALFNEQVGPLLTSKCLFCHEGERRKGGLDLTRRISALAGGEGGAAVVPGQPDESLMFEKVAGGEMPPKNPLRPEQVAAVRQWIEAGALTRRTAAPGVRGPTGGRSARSAGRAHPEGTEAWVRTPVDAFILARLKEQGLAPSPEADRAALIRRVSFDLTGLPPTPEEIAAFVVDLATDAYERLVDRLLASPRLRRALGPALARRRPVRREPRVRDRTGSGRMPGHTATT